MDLLLPEKIDRARWLSMLGADAAGAGQADLLRMDECERMLFDAARPKGTYVRSADLDYKGKSIARHLLECTGTVVLGMTLGRKVDETLMRLQVSDMAAGVVFDTGASLLAEAVCDLFEDDIRKAVEDDGLFMTSRFSPGYGDMPLSEQRKVIGLLNAERTIGLTLNSSDLMIPLKSITAICGTSDHPVKGSLATCDECALRSECRMRKAGKTCADR